MKHVKNDLMKFWCREGPSTLIDGMFHSYFTHEGEVLSVDSRKWPKEYQEAGGTEAEGLLEDADKDFVRAHSRQTFGYGVAYHMTGDVRYFELCKQGTKSLMSWIQDDGSMCTYRTFNERQWEHQHEERTSQDLAYGMTGLAFYYYLTHDELALDKLLKLKKHIFSTY